MNPKKELLWGLWVDRTLSTASRPCLSKGEKACCLFCPVKSEEASDDDDDAVPYHPPDPNSNP